MTDITVKKNRGGELTVAWSGHDVGRSIPLDEVAALREYFRAERDKELGWWRASSCFVVRLRDGSPMIRLRSVTVLNELRGITATVWEGDDSRSEYGIAARAYFDAHSAPKAWMDAAPGEVWLITAEDEAGFKVTDAAAVVSDSSSFLTEKYLFTRNDITAGRRIYPAQDGDNDE